jgi:ribosome modulation factor
VIETDEMIKEHVTIQEPVEFLFVGAVIRMKECIGKRIVFAVVRGCQPAVEEVSDFDWLGMCPITSVNVREKWLWNTVHRDKAQKLGQ